MSIYGDILAAKMMFEEDAVIGPARIVITGTSKINGIKRLIFGGVVLSGKVMQGINQWKCMDGMVCLVPTKTSEIRSGLEGYRIDQLMTSLSDLTEEDIRRYDEELIS